MLHASAPTRAAIRLATTFLLIALCAGCSGGSRTASHWDGRRGYDGSGDYGYDAAASRREARDYRAHASRRYPAPGTREDPWGPYIGEASRRFGVPERWIRAVMRQESGGHLYEADGSPITSPVGAMGLMQVMPGTYDMLRQRYGLGSDPFEPRDNVAAGTAYIREMYDRYGSPDFLAAYNAGPYRLEAHRYGGQALPDETVSYLASVAPALGPERPGAAANFGPATLASEIRAPVELAEARADDPSLRAFDGGGLVTPGAPAGFAPATTASQPQEDFTGQLAQIESRDVEASPARLPIEAAASFPNSESVAAAGFAAPIRIASRIPAPVLRPRVEARLVPIAAAVAHDGDWAVQVGAYADPATSRAAIDTARSRAADLLDGTRPAIVAVRHGDVLYRARLVGLTAQNAVAACASLSHDGLACLAVPPGS